MFGDFYGELWTPPWSRYISMSTAIARIYTQEGFVIAADGRKTRAGTREVASDSERKIFGIQQPGKCLAYALAGSIQLNQKGSDVIRFDLRSEVEKAAMRLTKERPKSLYHYAERLGEEICDSFEQVKDAHDDLDPIMENSTSNILFDGYYGTHAKRVTIELVHHLHEKSTSDVKTNDFVPGHPIGYGSTEVFTLVENGDARFADYRANPKDARNVTLSEAIQIAANVIRAHRHAEALKIDEKRCSAVGGKLHIATLTYTDAFQWAPGFGWPGTADQML